MGEGQEPRAIAGPQAGRRAPVATGPRRTRVTESPQSGAREETATTPLPFGPHTGKPASSARRRRSSSNSTPEDTSPNPAAKTIAPPQPRAAI